MKWVSGIFGGTAKLSDQILGLNLSCIIMNVSQNTLMIEV